MIVVNARIESTRDDIRILTPTLMEMEAASRAEEGCLGYSFSVELSNPSIIHVTEKWASTEALQAHFKSAHMAAFQRKIAQYPPTSTDVKFYRVEEIALP
jgi:quinol monooxygenase YgiN